MNEDRQTNFQYVLFGFILHITFKTMLMNSCHGDVFSLADCKQWGVDEWYFKIRDGNSLWYKRAFKKFIFSHTTAAAFMDLKGEFPVKTTRLNITSVNCVPATLPPRPNLPPTVSRGTG